MERRRRFHWLAAVGENNAQATRAGSALTVLIKTAQAIPELTASCVR